MPHLHNYVPVLRTPYSDKSAHSSLRLICFVWSIFPFLLVKLSSIFNPTVFVGRGLEYNFRINGQDINKTSLWKQPKPKYVFSPFSPDQLDSNFTCRMGSSYWIYQWDINKFTLNILHSNLVYANSHISFSRFLL